LADNRQRLRHEDVGGSGAPRVTLLTLAAAVRWRHVYGRLFAFDARGTRAFAPGAIVNGLPNIKLL